MGDQQKTEENILFEPESRAVKLADFGSAKVREFENRWTLLLGRDGG